MTSRKHGGTGSQFLQVGPILDALAGKELVQPAVVLEPREEMAVAALRVDNPNVFKVDIFDRAGRLVENLWGVIHRQTLKAAF